MTIFYLTSGILILISWAVIKEVLRRRDRLRELFAEVRDAYKNNTEMRDFSETDIFFSIESYLSENLKKNIIKSGENGILVRLDNGRKTVMLEGDRFWPTLLKEIAEIEKKWFL